MERQHRGQEQVPLLQMTHIWFPASLSGSTQRPVTPCGFWYLWPGWRLISMYIYTHIGMRTQLQISFQVSSAWCGSTHL